MNSIFKTSNTQYCFYIFCSLFLLSLNFYASAQTISVGILTNSGDQRTFYTSFARQFEEENPNITIQLEFKSDAEYKELLPNWLSSGNGPDLINWQGGERLFQYVRKDQVANLNDFWQSHNLKQSFSSGSISAVSFQNNPYAIPISYYQWGFYYRQSVFSALNLTPPTNWDEFLRVCDVLKQNGIAPITIGAKYKWPAAAWFDYLNLRVNGLAFHQQLLQGKIAFTDNRVRNVLTNWKQLLDNEYFVTQLNKWKWDEAMPFLYHKMAGMTLMGNFFTGTLPKTIKEDFKFFRFPLINNDVEVFEEAPLDIFMLPKHAENNAAAKKFLLALTTTQFQEPFAEKMGMISPNLNSAESEDYFIRSGSEALNQAQGLSQFFDRDTNEQMASAAMRVFVEFMNDKNIKKALAALESARNTHLN